jgi:hypothetical protein
MRKYLVVAATVFSVDIASGAVFARQLFHTYGSGNSSCGAWLEQGKKNPDGVVRVTYEVWVVGYASRAGAFTDIRLKQTEARGMVA